MLLDTGIAMMFVGAGLLLASIVLRLTWARRPSAARIRWSRAVWRGAPDRTDGSLSRTGSSAQGLGGGNDEFVDGFTRDKSS